MSLHEDPTSAPELAPTISPRAELAVMARALHREGYDDFPAGHITLRQPDDTFLTNPWGLDWDELRASDVIRIDKQGDLVEGRGRVTAGVMLHLEFHEARPDTGALLHNHPRFGTIWAAKHAVPPAYSQTSCQIADDEIVVVNEYAGAVDERGAARQSADAVGGAAVAILGNHGVLVAGRDAAEAYTRAVNLEWRCRFAYGVELVGGGHPMPEAGKRSLRDAMQRFPVLTGFRWAHAIRRELRADPGVLA